MTRDEWDKQADRISGAWPTPPMDEARRDVYYEVLHDLEPDAIDEAITALLREARESVPAPGVIRAHAERAAKPVAVSGIAGIPGLPGTPTPARKVADAGDGPETRSDQEEREGRRPWLGVLFGILGLFPLALWFGIRSLVDRKRAKAEGRKPAGDLWAAITAIAVALVSMIILTSVIARATTSDDEPVAVQQTSEANQTLREASDEDTSDPGTKRPASQASIDANRDGIVRDLTVQMRELMRPGGGDVYNVRCSATTGRTSVATVIGCSFESTSRYEAGRTPFGVDAYVSQDDKWVYWDFGTFYAK